MIQNIHLTASTAFDAAKVAEGLRAQFDTVQDPLGSAWCMLTGAFDGYDINKKQRLAKPTEFPLMTTLVMVESNAIVITQTYANAEQNRSTRNFVAWLLTLYDFRIQDDYGKDRTEEFRQEGMKLLFAEQMERGARAPAVAETAPIIISIVPGEEEEPFDAAKVRERLAAQFESLVDPLGSGAIMMCGLREHSEVYQRLRIEDPSRFPACPIARIEADRIEMTFADVDVNRERSARNFILWVQHEYPMARILDVDGADVTDECYTDGIRVLFASAS
jgi:hypothetical protein